MSAPRRFEEAMTFVENLCHTGIKLGLGNTRRLLEKLGDPHRQLRVIHVAGTNGKGSVCTMLTAALKETGLRTGLYTSPHLVSIRERFCIDGAAIPEAEWCDLVFDIHERTADLFSEDREQSPTFFEYLTVLALEYFARRRVDVAVIEVGMGGRLDSTNVVHPLVSIVTGIDLDHTKHLGRTLADIAGEKAGIIKSQVPVVSGERKPEAAARIAEIAAERDALVFQIGREFDVHGYQIDTIRRHPRQRNRVSWRGRETTIESQLAGRHQSVNVAIAYAALSFLCEQGMAINTGAIAAGVAKARWPARLQFLSDRLILDVAHNPSGLEALIDSLEALFPGRQWDVMFSIVSDKPSAAMLRLLRPICRSLILPVVNNERAASPESLRLLAEHELPDLSVHVCESVAAGIAQLKRSADGLIAGSLYMAGEVLALVEGPEPVKIID